MHETLEIGSYTSLKILQQLPNSLSTPECQMPLSRPCRLVFAAGAGAFSVGRGAGERSLSPDLEAPGTNSWRFGAR